MIYCLEERTIDKRILVVTIINPFLGLVLLLANRKKIDLFYSQERVKKYIFVLAIIAGGWGYAMFYPFWGDFVKIIPMIRRISYNSIFYLLESKVMDSCGVFNIWYFFIARTGNYHLLCVIPAFIIYFVLVKNVLYTGYLLKSDYMSIAVTALIAFMGLQFVQAVENGRSMISYALIILAIYLRTYDSCSLKKVFLLMCIALALHISSVVLIVLAGLAFLCKRYRFLVGILISMGIHIFPIIYKIKGFFPAYLCRYIEKLNYFYAGKFPWGEYVWNNSYHMTLRIILVTMIINILLVYYIGLRHYGKNEKIINNKYILFVIYIGFWAIGLSIIHTDLYRRFAQIFIIGTPAIYLSLAKCLKKHKRILYISMSIELVLSALIFVLGKAMLYINEYKGVVEIVYDYVSCSPIYIMFNDLISLIKYYM